MRDCGLHEFTNFGIRSDHSIRERGAYRELHEWMTEFLIEKWGSGPRQRGW